VKLLPVAESPFLTALERNWPRIRLEVDRLDAQRDYLAWPLRDAYEGQWRVFPLFFPSTPFLPVDVAANRARCPRTTRVLAALPGLQGAGFSWLGPRSRVLLHCDHYAPGVVRCHLGLRIPAGACMRVRGEELRWQEGRCLVFDGQIEHEAVNPTDEPRIVLLADFRAGPQPRRVR